MIENLISYNSDTDQLCVWNELVTPIPVTELDLKTILKYVF